MKMSNDLSDSEAHALLCAVGSFLADRDDAAETMTGLRLEHRDGYLDCPRVYAKDFRSAVSKLARIAKCEESDYDYWNHESCTASLHYEQE